MANSGGQGITTHLDLLIKIGGTEIQKNLIHDVLVESELDQPDMAAITLANHNIKYSETLKEGDPFEITLGHVEGAKAQTVFKGEVTGIEPTFLVGATNRVVIRGLNALHTLARGKKSVSYLNSTDKDIVDKICGQHGLTADFGSAAPTKKYEHVYQHNQTDLEFLRLRAARIGFHVLVEDTKLFFRKRTEEDSGIVLEYRVGGDATLEKFMPRLSTANQVTEVRVRGWDPEKKKEIVGIAKPESSKLGDKTGSQIANQKHSNVLAIDVDVAVFSKEEADSIAKSILDDRLMSFITGEGVCKGMPSLRPGVIVDVQIPDKRFMGKYFVTAVRHRYVHTGASGGFRTEFRVRRDARKE